MRFQATPIPGLLVIDIEPHHDERGLFARTFCADELANHGIRLGIAQCSVSFSPHARTLRGLHFQAPPHAEVKLVRCTRGAVFDVTVDLRRDSPTQRRWFAVKLTSENRRALLVPEGCAHGFLTLMPDTEVSYMMSTPFHPELARGVRWDDPAFAIAWPMRPILMSERDATYPDYGSE